MTVRSSIVVATCAGLACLALLCPDQADARGRSRKSDRPASDMRIKLKVRGKRKGKRKGNGKVLALVKVKNRGRLDQQNVEVVLRDADSATPLWSDVISLASGERKSFRVKLLRDEIGDVLTAECRGDNDDDDESPEDNEDSEHLAPRKPVEPAAAARGRDIYVPLCSGCHGADGRGGTVRENIAKEPWGEFLEAFDEGEDGMPRFRDLKARDARDIVAYLRDPDSVLPPPPPPPVDPPPAGTTPTYSQQVGPILDAACATCHGGSFTAAGIALNTYTSASLNASAALVSIDAGRMPPSGSMQSSDVETIRDWINGGKPQ